MSSQCSSILNLKSEIPGEPVVPVESQWERSYFQVRRTADVPNKQEEFSFSSGDYF